MKIALLSFYSGHMERGVENWVFELGSRLAKNNEVTVFQNIIGGTKTNYKIVPTNLAVDWEAKDSRGTLTRRFFLDYWSRLICKFTLKIVPEIIKERYDIIVPTNSGWQVFIPRILSIFTGSKIVLVGHSGKGWEERVGILMFPDIFVGLSKFASRWAKRVNPLVRTVIIPNGIDLDGFNPDGPRAKIDLERPIILCVAAPEKEKRLDLVVRAVSKLKGVSLLILGKGYNEAELYSQGRKLLGNRFMVKGVDFREIPKYYRNVDLFTLPTWKNEAFGLVYLEAMATNLPIVATNDEVRREIIGEAGILIDPTNIDEYAKALERALKTDWGDKPRRQAEKFDWDKIARRYEDLFRSLGK